METRSGTSPPADLDESKVRGSVQHVHQDKADSKTHPAANGAKYDPTPERSASILDSDSALTSSIPSWRPGGTSPLGEGPKPDKSAFEKPEEGSSTNLEKEWLLKSQSVKTYSRRWYVLAVFSVAAMMQSALWNTWGPIAQSAKATFGWDDSLIGMFANWGNIVYVIAILPITYLMDVKGLRVAMVVCTVLCAAAAGIRCVTSDLRYITWIMNIAAVLNGVGGTALFAGAPLVSITWFPLDQRNTATAIASVFPYIGIALSFIIGPLFVPEPVRGANYSESFNNNTWINITGARDISEMRDAIMRLMYIEAGIWGALLVVVVLYFPARPPNPPTFAASTSRTSYATGLKQLLRNKSLWLILAAYGLPVGVFGVWGAVLDVNLHPVGVTQSTAGWVGFYSTLAGCVSCVALSRLADKFQRRLKMFVLILLFGSVVSVVWITLLCLRFIPFNTPSLYISCILAGFFINGTVPLFYELGCESAYPVAEGLTGGILTLVNNLTGILFLLILLIPNIGVTWMNWVLLGSAIIALPIMCLFKEDYSRTNLDMEIDVSPPE